MKVCYLVFAHARPAHFGRLVRALTASANNTVVVHLDAYADLAAFSDVAPVSDQVFYTQHRVHVRWGAFSQVEALLELMRAGIAAASTADYFALLSGDTYPLTTQEYYHATLDADPTKEYFNILPMPSLGKDLTRISRYYFGHDLRSSRLRYVLNELPRFTRRDYRRALGELQPYCGSTWWTLTNNAVRYLLSAASRERRWAEFCRHSLCSDEHFLHTLLGNSEFIERVAPAQMFVEFPPVGPSPAIIDDAWVDWLAANDRVKIDPYGTRELFFARKFDDDSAELLERLRSRLWRRASPE